MSTTSIYRSIVAGILLAHATAQSYDPHDVESSNDAGAAGPSSNSVNMSSGGLIALCVIVGAVVVIGISSAVLFYIAKKRQWEMREALRRSGKRVIQAVKTPLTPRFPRTPKTPRPPTRGRDQLEREERQMRAQLRKEADLEKDTVSAAAEEKEHSSERSTKGWSSYFSFGRS